MLWKITYLNIKNFQLAFFQIPPPFFIFNKTTRNFERMSFVKKEDFKLDIIPILLFKLVVNFKNRIWNFGALTKPDDNCF